MKKLCILVLVLVVAISSLSVYATSDKKTSADLAYMDIDSAPAELRDDILEARNSIIFSQDWSDTGEAYILSPDGSKRMLPKFSDLFPNWELPVVGETVFESAELERSASVATTRGSQTYHPMLWRPSSTTISPPFASVVATIFDITVKAVKLPGSHYNIGLSDVNNNSVTSVERVKVNEILRYPNPKPGKSYRMRASTHTTTGYAEIFATW